MFTNGCLVVAATRLARWGLAEEEALVQAAGGLVLFAGLALASIAAASPLGLTPLAGAGVAASLAAASARIRLPAAAPARPAPIDGARLADAAALGLLTGGLALWARQVLAGTVFEWDDLTYHAAIPAWWLSHGGLGRAELTYQAYFPLGAEAVAAWLMVPTHSDLHANLGLLLWAALAVTAGMAIARQQGRAWVAAPLAMACFLVSPRLLKLGQTFAGPDLALAALCAASLAFAWIPPGAGPLRTERRALASGLAAGLALGTKVTAAPAVLLLGLWWARVAWAAGRRRPLAGFLGAALVGAPWYVADLVQTGNPIFPAALGPFPGPMTRDVQHLTSLLPGVLEGWSDPAFWLRYWEARGDWPLALGGVAGAGYLLGALSVARGSDAEGRAYRLLLLAVGVVCLGSFPFQPFSATTNRPDAEVHDMARFLTTAFLVGAILVPSLATTRALALGSAAIPAGGLAWLWVASSRWPPPFLAEPWPWIGAGFCAGALLHLLRARRPDLPWRHGPAALGLGVLATSAVLAGPRAAATEDSLLRFGGRRPIGAAWAALESLPEGSEIAFYSRLPASHALLHPLFGRRLQHRAVVVGPDGARLPALHRRWRTEGHWWWEWSVLDDAVDPATLAAHLRGGGVDFVVLSRWPGQATGRWPPQRGALASAWGEERRVYQDGYSEIWAVGGEGPTAMPGGPGRPQPEGR